MEWDTIVIERDLLKTIIGLAIGTGIALGLLGAFILQIGLVLR